jgi:uncharacterized membrane protein YeaQ/YmgE (transglycosylase-associated protein family)
MENLLPLLIQIASGAIGGNVAGSLMKNLSLGTIGNSLLGVIGGGLGGQLLGLLGLDLGGAEMGLGSILGSVASGGVGGGALMAIIGAVKKSMNK